MDHASTHASFQPSRHCFRRARPTERSFHRDPRTSRGDDDKNGPEKSDGKKRLLRNNERLHRTLARIFTDKRTEATRDVIRNLTVILAGRP